MIDSSDKATGLPSLDEPSEESTIWVMAFQHGQADVLSPIDGSPQGCLWLGIRGLAQEPNDGQTSWVQAFIAFPHGTITELRDRLSQYLEDCPE
jgi:hypothetical protein